MAATLYLRASGSVPFTAEPLVRVSGSLLRIANPSKRLWCGAIEAEQQTPDGWVPLPLERVQRLCGETHASPLGVVRASGRFFPLSFACEAGSWRLGYQFDPGGQQLGRRRQGRLVGVTVTLTDVDAGAPLTVGDEVYAVLAGDESDYVCAATVAGADTSTLRLAVTPKNIAVAGS